MALLDTAATALTAVSELSTDPSEFFSLSDADLLALSHSAAAIERQAATHAALIAGEIARRSDRSLGHDGLAARTGYRTPEQLVRSVTGGTSREASTSVRVGRLVLSAAESVDIATGSVVDATRPWLAPVASALGSSLLSPSAAESIQNGLGEPREGVTVEALRDAASRLCDEALTLDADRLYRRARELRDELDEAGIADREAARRAQRSLRYTSFSDGSAQLTWRLDPESAAVCGELYDRMTSPRRGGPRFVDPEAIAAAERIANDERTTEQLASDVFLELLRQGAAADSSHLLGSGAPVVRVLVTAEALESRTGHGFIEGQSDPISIETVERLACEGATQIVPVDAAGNPLNVGHEQRLFTKRQRIALAVRDGGCRWPGCDRPPSWTEAHHVEHWIRDHGATDLENGVLLCRYCHLLLHNNGWEITSTPEGLMLIPPADVDPARTPRPMKPARASSMAIAARVSAHETVRADR